MSMPTPEQWRALGEVLITWGFWAIVYGIITMCIGLIIIAIIAICNKQIIKILR